jgi:hypothetical protein
MDVSDASYYIWIEKKKRIKVAKRGTPKKKKKKKNCMKLTNRKYF